MWVKWESFSSGAPGKHNVAAAREDVREDVDRKVDLYRGRQKKYDRPAVAAMMGWWWWWLMAANRVKGAISCWLDRGAVRCAMKPMPNEKSLALPPPSSTKHPVVLQYTLHSFVSFRPILSPIRLNQRTLSEVIML